MIASLNVRATSGNKLICAAENNVFLLLIVFCIVFLFGTISRAAKQFLINDEIFTHYVMSLGSLREIWVALSARADGNPPLSYLIEAATTSALSDNLITFRLPSILGFLAFSLCLYVFVSRRTTRLQGLLAAIIPSISEAYFVAYEARPYAQEPHRNRLRLCRRHLITLLFGTPGIAFRSCRNGSLGTAA